MMTVSSFACLPVLHRLSLSEPAKLHLCLDDTAQACLALRARRGLVSRMTPIERLRVAHVHDVTRPLRGTTPPEVRHRSRDVTSLRLSRLAHRSSWSGHFPVRAHPLNLHAPPGTTDERPLGSRSTAPPPLLCGGRRGHVLIRDFFPTHHPCPYSPSRTAVFRRNLRAPCTPQTPTFLSRDSCSSRLYTNDKQSTRDSIDQHLPLQTAKELPKPLPSDDNVTGPRQHSRLFLSNPVKYFTLNTDVPYTHGHTINGAAISMRTKPTLRPRLKLKAGATGSSVEAGDMRPD